MKIYKYYKGQIYSLDVRETEKMYISERDDLVFSYKRRFRKEECHLSPEAAIEEAINIKGFSKERLEEKIVELNNDLRILQILKKEFAAKMVGCTHD